MTELILVVVAAFITGLSGIFIIFIQSRFEAFEHTKSIKDYLIYPAVLITIVSLMLISLNINWQSPNTIKVVSFIYPLILPLASIIVIVTTFFFIRNIFKKAEARAEYFQQRIEEAFRQTRSIQKTPNSTISEDTATRRIERIIGEKKSRFLKLPAISFHFANKAQIKAFYNDYFKELTLESLVSEMTAEKTGEIKGSIPQLLESKIGGSDINKYVSTFKLPDITEDTMFLRYQKETIIRGGVVLGIEEVDLELTELQAFESPIEYLKNNFGFVIDETTLGNQRNQLKEKAAEKTLIKLEQATGWILVEGKFKIEIAGDFYKCTYLHPVNAYLPNQIGPVTISVLMPSKSLEEDIQGNYTQFVGRSIPLKIYGQVLLPIDRQANIWDLQLRPLAVYQ